MKPAGPFEGDRSGMRILHTADWHLGRTLYHKTRYEEFEVFLNWLIQTIRERSIDVLLVSGDVFDTIAPSYRAQELYYAFLASLAKTDCSHAIITAGNHDSPTFIEAPRLLLSAMDIHVIGNATDPIDREVLMLRDRDGNPELIVCAVPYLREREIRRSEAAESLEAKEEKLRKGIASHYAQVADIAVRMRDALQVQVPIVAMGHLYTAGGETVDGDGVRKLYVGDLAHIESNIFSKAFDYVALGHLHVPQRVGGLDSIRFSGSPIPMGFGEAKQQKYVNLVQWTSDGLSVELIPVPRIQRLESVEGEWSQIEHRLEELKSAQESVWIEVAYCGTEPIANLREKIEQNIHSSQLELLRASNGRSAREILARGDSSENLEELQPIDVFARCLAINDVPEEKRQQLKAAYEEILMQVQR